MLRTLFPYSFFLLLFLHSFCSQAQQDSSLYYQSDELIEKTFSYLRALEYDSALITARASIAGYEKFNDWEQVVKAKVLISNNFLLSGKFDLFFPYADETYALAIQKLPPNNAIRAYAFNNKAMTYNEKGDYKLAIELFETALSADSLTSQNLATIYSSLGLAYRRKGDYGEAVRYYSFARNLFQQNDDEASSFELQNQARAINSHAKALRFQEDWGDALKALASTDSIYQLLDIEKVYRKRIDCAHSMAYCYIGQKDYSAAKAQLSRALALEAGRKTYQEEVKAEIRAELAFSEGDKNKALAELQSALSISKEKSKPQETIQRLGQRIAEINALLGDYLSAQSQLDEAMLGIASKLNPSAEDYIYPSLGIPLLAQMADLTTQIAVAQSKPAKLDSALMLYKALSNLVRYNRNRFQADNSRLFLGAQTIPIYERAIDLCYQRYSQTRKRRYLDEAFSFSELGKATLLQEALQSDAATNSQLIPDSLRIKERTLQQDIAFFKEKLFLNPVSDQEAESDSSLQARWQGLLFERENQYRQLSEQLEKNYPRYYEEKYAVADWNLQDLQNLLGGHQLIIEYFWGKDALYIFKIGASSIQFEKIALTQNLTQPLQRMQSFLSKPNASDKAYVQYQEDAYEIFDQLIGPLVPSFAELIIIPDGPLGYLAFDALLTRQVNPEDQLRYHELPYLLKKYRLHYQYSSAFLLRPDTQTKEAPFAYGGFAPSYPAAPNAQRGTQMVLNQALPQLAFTKEEVSNTHAIWGGKTYLDEAATKEAFLQDAANYNLLHLAMHGLLSGENTEFAALAFHPSSDSAGEFLLSMEEIAAMELKAKLVVLSACETGAGRLRQGEGIISMARAFREAGSPNILMSLWTADDKSSTLIMQDFFGRLKSGDQLAEAIRAAKLELMSTQFLQSHPYYWAGFVPLGNPNDSKQNSHLLLIGIMLLMGVGIGFMAYRKAEA